MGFFSKSPELEAHDWIDRGYSLHKLGRYEEAIKAYDRAIKLNPNDAFSWTFKGMSLAELYRHNDAINAYDRAIEIDPKYKSAWNRKGESLEKMGRHDDAIEAFDRAIELDPKIANVWINKGESLEKMGRYDDAIEAYNRSIKISPIKRVIKKRDDLLKVVPYTRIIQQTGHPENPTPISNLNRHKDAVKAYGRENKLDPNDVVAWNNKAYNFHQVGRYDDAVKAYDRVIELDPKRSSAWNSKGISLAALGCHDDAIKAYDRSIELDPKRTSIWNNKGISLAALDCHKDAIKAYDQAIKLDPKYARAWINKGDSLAALRRYHAAINAYDRAIGLDGSNVQAIENRAAAIKNIPETQILQQTDEPVNGALESYSKTADIPHSKTPEYVIERTIFDPVSGTFLVSKNRPLVNVETWVQKTDPNSYWLIICIHNNSSSLIDEWGIELDSSASLRILECHIEGMEHKPVLNESHTVPWQSKWIIGVPHHFGITLPRNGSRRLYLKLSSSTCGVSHSFKGNLIVPGGIQIPIPEKSFEHSCDVATLSTALSKNPAAAEQFTENLLMSTYSREIALKYIQSFKLVQEIDRSCSIGNHDATIDKLNQLINALEGTQVSPSLIESVKSNLWAIQQLGDTEDASIRGQRLCRNIVDEWLNEVIYKQKKLD